MTLGERIFNIRQAKKLTQQGLAKSSGVDATIISCIENDKRTNLQMDTITRLATGLGVTVSTLCDGVDFRS